MQRLNFQTKVIVATAIALTAVDLSVRGFLAPRVYNTGRTGDVVTAREFRLVGQNGELRAHIFTDENNEPGIVLYDRNGTRRAQLDTFQEVPSLLLFSPEGTWSSYFGMDNVGKGILNMYDNSGMPIAGMSVSDQDGVANNSGFMTRSTPNGTVIYQSRGTSFRLNTN